MQTKDMSNDELFAALKEWSDSLPQHQPGYVYNPNDFTSDKVKARLGLVTAPIDELMNR